MTITLFLMSCPDVSKNCITAPSLRGSALDQPGAAEVKLALELAKKALGLALEDGLVRAGLADDDAILKELHLQDDTSIW